MNAEFGFNTEYLEECFKRRKKPEERIYPKKDWPVGYEPTKKEFEEWMEEGTGIPVSFEWKDIGGGKKRGVFTPIKKNIKIPPKESLIYGASGDIDGTTVFMERKGEGRIFKESYYEPRSEEEKKQIIEQNRKRRELEKSQETKKIEDKDLNELANGEKSQTENPVNSDKKEQKTGVNQENLSQKLENKDNNSKNIYYGVGLISLVLLATGLVVVKIKKKK